MTLNFNRQRAQGSVPGQLLDLHSLPRLSQHIVFKYICAPRIPTFISKVPLLILWTWIANQPLDKPTQVTDRQFTTSHIGLCCFFSQNLLCLLLLHQLITTPFFWIPTPKIPKSSFTPFSLTHTPQPVQRHNFLVLPSEYLQHTTTSPHLHCLSDLISHHSATMDSLVSHYETKPLGLCTSYIPFAYTALSLAGHQA